MLCLLLEDEQVVSTEQEDEPYSTEHTAKHRQHHHRKDTQSDFPKELTDSHRSKDRLTDTDRSKDRLSDTQWSRKKNRSRQADAHKSKEQDKTKVKNSSDKEFKEKESSSRKYRSDTNKSSSAKIDKLKDSTPDRHKSSGEGHIRSSSSRSDSSGGRHRHSSESSKSSTDSKNKEKTSSDKKGQPSKSLSTEKARVPEMSLLSQIIRDQDDLLTHELDVVGYDDKPKLLPTDKHRIKPMATGKGAKNTATQKPEEKSRGNESEGTPASCPPAAQNITKKEASRRSNAGSLESFTGQLKASLSKPAPAGQGKSVRFAVPMPPITGNTCTPRPIPQVARVQGDPRQSNRNPQLAQSSGGPYRDPRQMQRDVRQLADMTNRDARLVNRDKNNAAAAVTSIKLTEDSVLKMILSFNPLWLQEQGREHQYRLPQY